MSELTRVLRIAFIGCGTVNFGRWNVPWNHSTRLEAIGGIHVLAIVEPETKKAEEILYKKQTSPQSASLYNKCVILSDPAQLLPIKPDVVFIGIPPFCRGQSSRGKDIELMFIKAGVHVFVEKPLSSVPMTEFREYSEAVSQASLDNNVILCVGYMFRYHPAVLKMKAMIDAHGGKVMNFNARYYYAYTEAANKYWYNKTLSGGPIVEQATHFCDLARYLAGDVDLSSVHTLALKDSDETGAGHLPNIPSNAEEDIPPENRIPRVTISHWRFKNGGLGSLTHSIALPGSRYEATIDLQMAGLKLSLIEPYEDHCVLRVRTMETGKRDEDQDFTFKGCDSYKVEIETFINAVRSKNQSIIQSSYADATKTYEMTWTIRKQGETDDVF